MAGLPPQCCAFLWTLPVLTALLQISQEGDTKALPAMVVKEICNSNLRLPQRPRSRKEHSSTDCESNQVIPALQRT